MMFFFSSSRFLSLPDGTNSQHGSLVVAKTSHTSLSAHSDKRSIVENPLMGDGILVGMPLMEEQAESDEGQPRAPGRLPYS